MYEPRVCAPLLSLLPACFCVSEGKEKGSLHIERLLHVSVSFKYLYWCQRSYLYKVCSYVLDLSFYTSSVSFHIWNSKKVNKECYVVIGKIN